MMELGLKLRQLRKAKRFSLKQLAARSGCSTSYLSMIENGKIDPGISRLKKIADGLGITIVDLFQDSQNGKVVIRKNDRICADLDKSKTRIEILVPPSENRQIDARLAVISPGGSSEGDYKHPGEEFGLLLAGTLDLTVGGVTHHLETEDSFYFPSTLEHRFKNPGKQNAVVLWVNHPPTW